MDQVISSERRIKVRKVLIFLIVGAVLSLWLLNTPPGLFGKADAIGYAVCHQIDLRSFHIGDRAMPLCARCSGMYLGAVLSIVFLSILSPKHAGSPSKLIMFLSGALVFLFVLDGVNSYLNLPFFPSAPSLYAPNNVTRLLTGTGMGIVLAVILYPAFNQTMWVDWSAKPVFKNAGSFLILVLLALIVDLIVLTENPVFLYPLALVSVLGVLLLLSMVYGMLILILLRRENQIKKMSALFLPMLAGFGVAIIQIGLLDFIRYLLTGTWDGFHF